jgi:hypothetical protein
MFKSENLSLTFQRVSPKNSPPLGGREDFTFYEFIIPYGWHNRSNMAPERIIDK